MSTTEHHFSEWTETHSKRSAGKAGFLFKRRSVYCSSVHFKKFSAILKARLWDRMEKLGSTKTHESITATLILRSKMHEVI